MHARFTFTTFLSILPLLAAFTWPSFGEGVDRSGDTQQQLQGGDAQPKGVLGHGLLYFNQLEEAEQDLLDEQSDWVEAEEVEEEEEEERLKRVVRRWRSRVLEDGDEAGAAGSSYSYDNEEAGDATDAPTPSTNAPTPSTNAPTPSTNAPTPSTNAPTPSTNAPTPSTNAPTPSTNAPTDAPIAEPTEEPSDAPKKDAGGGPSGGATAGGVFAFVGIAALFCYCARKNANPPKPNVDKTTEMNVFKRMAETAGQNAYPTANAGSGGGGKMEGFGGGGYV
ncbi:hypothetical protein TeGR_g3387 [Tetraparma gracilis]|uniref:Transmembrane protein n=1 Tax=Tetraparma gracilis TaxID=2962635 RepID=A0ABQ6MJM0_9STRA|nr:hypothetical protein TeGR_g3387 [Tetraparma gracilis]